MASESQLSSAGVTISGGASQVLDKFLTDVIPSSVVTSNAGSGSVVQVSSGGHGDTNLIITPPSTPILGSISDGSGKTVDFQLPANIGIVGKSVLAPNSGDLAALSAFSTDFVSQIVNKYIPLVTEIPTLVEHRDSIIEAFSNAVKFIPLQIGNFVIRNFDFFNSNASLALEDNGQTFALLNSDGSYQGVDSLVGANDVLLDAGGSNGNQLFVVNLAGLENKSLALKNVDAAVLAGSGTVRAEGATPILITSDNKAQNISGNDGNDTLVGTGSDTLTGGGGNDVFGFSGAGKYTITDFNKAGDMLAFDVNATDGVVGVTNLDQLKAKVTSVVATSTSITYNLGADTSITLVGVSPNELTAGMIKFTISG